MSTFGTEFTQPPILHLLLCHTPCPSVQTSLKDGPHHIKEYEVFTRGINKSVPSVPPTGSSDELKQIEMWQRYISWERSNPLRVEDPALVTKRVMFAYEQVSSQVMSPMRG